jgi:hypothetical protein
MSPKRSSRPSSAYTPFNKVKLIKGGHAYFELLENIIREAKDTIHCRFTFTMRMKQAGK